jgi:hypothetical protein
MENLEGSTRFIFPALLEDGLAASQLPPSFRKLTLGNAPAGQPSPELLRDCINAVRQQRSRRNV